MDESFGWVCILFGVFLLALVGIVHLAADFRHYGDVYAQCQKQGFIQNQTTRITCKVE